MKVLVATSLTQGEDIDDFCNTTDGELVIIPGDCLTADCRCERGCDPTFLGLSSGERTTTTTIVNRPDINPALYAMKIAEGLHRLGLIDPTCSGCDDCDNLLWEYLMDLEFLVGPGLEGDVICRMGCDYSHRHFDDAVA